MYKTILIVFAIFILGCNNITGTHTLCTRIDTKWTCTNPVEEPVLDITIYEEENKITCIRRPKLDRMIMEDWKCPGVKGGLPADFPVGYFVKDSIR
jgi:hypothetical protein